MKSHFIISGQTRKNFNWRL